MTSEKSITKTRLNAPPPHTITKYYTPTKKFGYQGCKLTSDHVVVEGVDGGGDSVLPRRTVARQLGLNEHKRVVYHIIIIILIQYKSNT